MFILLGAVYWIILQVFHDLGTRHLCVHCGMLARYLRSAIDRKSAHVFSMFAVTILGFSAFGMSNLESNTLY